MGKTIDVPNQGRVEFPDSMSDEDIVAAIKKNAMSYPAQPATPSMLSNIGQGIGNLAAGAVRGAGSIGATLLWPIDKATDLIQGDRGPTVAGLITGKQPLSRNEERRAAMEGGLSEMGAQPDSFLYKAGKLGGEIAGTAGAGGMVANGLRVAAPALDGVGMAAPTIDALVNATRTGGFATGASNGALTPLANMAVRVGGGALSGAAAAGMVDPSQAGTGALIGGALPPVVKAGGLAGSAIASTIGNASNKLMQSAIKPTIKQLQSGDAGTAVQTLLDYGINPTMAGVQKLRDLISSQNDQIKNAIGNSGATVSKQKVLDALDSVRQRFGNQVSPTSDLGSIQSVADDFAGHPNIPGNDIPVQLAQDLKQGTYKILAKKYGQLGTADTEAQKALARGLKDEIAGAVPEVAGLNAEESRLITTLGVTERRALMELNKNPMGLASLAHNPASWAMVMADKSALFKSLAARMLNATAEGAGASGGLLENAMANPLLRSPAPLISGSSSHD